jgi:hypothetical protein
VMDRVRAGDAGAGGRGGGGGGEQLRCGHGGVEGGEGARGLHHGIVCGSPSAACARGATTAWLCSGGAGGGAGAGAGQSVHVRIFREFDAPAASTHAAIMAGYVSAMSKAEGAYQAWLGRQHAAGRVLMDASPVRPSERRYPQHNHPSLVKRSKARRYAASLWRG